MIKSFRDRQLQAFWATGKSRRVPPADLRTLTERKLAMLHAARSLDDLRIFPGNRLEALKGDRAGQHSIRVNDQFRLCFVWKENDAYQVEFVDYH